MDILEAAMRIALSRDGYAEPTSVPAAFPNATRIGIAQCVCLHVQIA